MKAEDIYGVHIMGKGGRGWHSREKRVGGAAPSVFHIHLTPPPLSHGAGNSGWDGLGTVQSPALSKNALTVGASDSERDSTANRTVVASWSSLGPTQDGRIKPDVVAP